MRLVHGHSKRRAVAGILAAIFLFTMLFTVGLGFFMFVNNTNQFYSLSLAARGQAIGNKISENLAINTAVSSTGTLTFQPVNNGGMSANITNVIINFPNGTAKLYSRASPNTFALPIIINPGFPGSTVNTKVCVASGGCSPQISGTFVIRAITAAGSVFAATYPPTSSVPLASQSLASGAIGFLYLKFDSYAYFQVYSGGGCPTGGSNSGYCLSKQGPAFTISQSYFTGNYVAFSVQITDLDPAQRNITLDKFSSQVHNWPGGSSCSPDLCMLANTWYLITNSSNTILNTYAPVALTYNKPVTLVFASLTPGTFQANSFAQAHSPAAGTLVSIKMFWHGWLATSYSKITGPSPPVQNYGQNSPYVTTLFT